MDHEIVPAVHEIEITTSMYHSVLNYLE